MTRTTFPRDSTRFHWFGWRIPVSILAALVGAMLWELVAIAADVPFFPRLSSVLMRTVELSLDGTISQHIFTSLANLVVGFSISVVVGVGVGALMGMYWRVDAALNTWVMALLTAPTLVLAPVFFSVFGLSRATPIAIVVFYSVFIIILNARAGVRAVRVDQLEMARSFAAGRWDTFRLVVLPGAAPYAMAGLRLGAGRAVKGMINGEMYIAIIGLGGIIVSAGRVFDATTVLAVVWVVIVVALVLTGLVGIAERHLTNWLPRTQRD